MKKIPYGRQWIDEKDIRAVQKVLKSDWITQGPMVETFERAAGKFCNTRYAIALSSGTAALHAAYLAAGIGKGDDVITTPLTFAATSNMLALLGATSVFVDIDEDTLNINPKEIEKKITRRTKAIVTVDFAGHPCEYDTISPIAKRHNLLMIEDAAHAIGSCYKKKPLGSIADMTIFSFHPVKTIATGEGGMVLTNRKEFSETLKLLRHHGMIKKPEKGPWYYEIQKPGFNYRITDFQCALGLSQLKKIDAFIKKRREIVAMYNAAFKDIPEIIIPQEKEYAFCAWHLYVIQLRLEKLKVKRKKIFEALQKEGIAVQVHYIPLHLQPFYQKTFGYRKGDFPVAETYYERAITLPLFPKMTRHEVRYVINHVKRVIRHFCI